MAGPYVGEIRMFAGNFAPQGWMLCQGQILPISEYETLFNLIGTTYGGDGQSTFALPNLASRIPLHMGTGAGSSYVIADTGGTETVTLTTNQLPSHTHVVIADAGSTPGSNTPGNNYLGLTNFPTLPNPAPVTYTTFTAGANQRGLANNTLTSQGGSQPHDNMVPYLALNFIISLFGVYPSPT